MSGQRVILLLMAGVIFVALVTLALYLLTRQDEPLEGQPLQPNAYAVMNWE